MKLSAEPAFRHDAAAHTYHLGERRLESVTEAIKGVGLTWGDDSPEWARARERGKAVHQATAYDDEGDLDLASLDPVSAWLGEDLKPCIMAWREFRRRTGFTPIHIELARHHSTWLYAGTIDRIGTLPDGRMVLVDIKTGSMPGWVDLQTGAYELLVPEMRALQRWAVVLTTKGGYTLTPLSNPNDGQEFLAILTTYRRLTKHGRH